MQAVIDARLSDQRKALGNALDFTVDALQDEASGATALGAAMLMGLNEWPLKSAALGYVPRDASNVIDKLESARALFGADGAYVISADGVVVAHATKEVSTTGANVSFRAYFKSAMAGAANVYAAVGSVSGERGLYFAAPLRRDSRQTSEVIGVVMIKMPSDRVDQLLHFAGSSTLLLSPHGVVFASTRSEWLLLLAQPIDPVRIDDIRRLRQFGRRFDGQAPSVLPFRLDAQNVEIDGKRFELLKKAVEWNDPAGPWQAVALHSTSELMTGAQRSGVGLLAFVVLAALGLLLLQVVVGKRRIAAATARYNMMGAALEVSPMSVAITDTQGAIEWVNAQFEKDTGYSAKDVVNQPIGKLLAPADKQQEFPQVAQAVLAGKSWRGELSHKRKDGSLFPGHVLVSPIFGPNGEVTGFVNLLEDTTQAVALQQELVRAKEAADAANRSKGVFLANMSHEIRTPLNAIIGMAYLVRQSGLNPRQTDYVGKIQQSGQHLLAIIDDILDVSKVEAGKVSLEHIPFELANVLDQVDSVVGGKALSKGLALTRNVAPEVPHRLLGDPLRLRQILINYANNAVKFTSEGSIHIQVEAQQRLSDAVVVRFSVVDTGIGLTQEQSSRLFQNFEQADTSTTREFGGTGLGLAISKGLVELMGGHVGVRSELGQGATFWFTAKFGIGVEPGVAASAPAAIGLAQLAALSGARVLVVDDNDINQQVASELLRAAGFEVDLADNGQVAVANVAAMNESHTPYDLVLMDLQMPVMDGITAAGIIRADPRNNSLAIVAATASAMAQDRERCRAAGMNGFIAKPIDPDMLWKVAADLIKLRPGMGAAISAAGGSVAGVKGDVVPGDQAGTRAGFREPSQPGDRSLPDRIDGLDIALGLRRVMGRQDLYLSLLRKFEQSHVDVVQQLHAALTAQDAPLALRIVHTLKGVAGNIGAVSLEATAAALESALELPPDSPHAAHPGSGQLAELIAQTGRELGSLLSAIGALEARFTLHSAPMPLSATQQPFNAAQFEALCHRLAQLLAQRDFEAEELFSSQRKAFDAAFGRDALALKSAIDRFDFDLALVELQRARANSSTTIS